jgi:hypothetical protein
MTDFVNFKIKLVQSFGGAHKDRMCVCVFIRVSARRGSVFVLCFSKKN